MLNEENRDSIAGNILLMNNEQADEQWYELKKGNSSFYRQPMIN